ncbi:hypothetical protein ACROYT_G034231 [Oculina patagonica]
MPNIEVQDFDIVPNIEVQDFNITQNIGIQDFNIFPNIGIQDFYIIQNIEVQVFYIMTNIEVQDFDIVPNIEVLDFNIIQNIEVLDFNIIPNIGIQDFNIIPNIEVLDLNIKPNIEVQDFDIKPNIEVQDFDILPNIEVQDFYIMPYIAVQDFDIVQNIEVQDFDILPNIEVSSVQSPLMLSFAFENLGRQLRFLADVCMCSQAFKKAPDDPKPKFPTGVKLLTYLYQLCLEHSSSPSYPILLSLLKHSVLPYIMFVQTWAFKGICNDMFGEFMIEMDEQYLAYRDKNFWTQGFVMVGRDKLDCVPLFLGELADDIFVCGKTINLLKLCCPEHYLCDPGIPLPKMEVTFSMRRLSRIEEECKQYMTEIQRMHQKLQEQREKQNKAIEDEKQREILEERERAAKALSEITDLIQRAKDAFEQKKREDFKMLKEQMEEAFKHKALARKEEQEADIKRLQEAKDREVTTASVEEEMKNKAREELIKYYDELSREVEHREFRAQWLIRRRLLDSARAQFLAQEQARLDSLMDQITQASGAQNPVKTTDIADARPGKDYEKPEAREKVATPASAPSPSIVSLIASGVKTDALLKAEQGKSTSGLSDSTTTASNIANAQDEQLTVETTSSSEAATAESRARKTWNSPDASAAELEKLTEAGSGRKTWEAPPDGEVKIAAVTPKSHPSESSIQFAMYSDKQKSGEEEKTPGFACRCFENKHAPRS